METWKNLIITTSSDPPCFFVSEFFGTGTITWDQNDKRPGDEKDASATVAQGLKETSDIFFGTLFHAES